MLEFSGYVMDLNGLYYLLVIGVTDYGVHVAHSLVKQANMA